MLTFPGKILPNELCFPTPSDPVMVNFQRSLYAPVLTVLLCTAMLAGCTSLQVPKFDPQGGQLFAPGGETTELVNPFRDGPSIGIPTWPTSAFPAPDDPPVCRPETLASGIPPRDIPSSGTPGAVQVFPPRVAAPIGMEVIMRGAVYGEDGRFLHGRLLEWSLEEPAHGQFIDTGGGNPAALDRIFPSNLFSSQSPLQQQRLASSRSASRSETVTRGTRDTSDDLYIERGQSWVAVSSNTPGITRLSLTASTVEGWDQQPAAATIQWLDVRWQFPLPQSVELGETAHLKTTLATATSTSPLPGWKIRYSVEQGSQARLGPDALQTIDVATDNMGTTAVTVHPGGEKAEEVRVLTEIFVPGSLVADEEMVIARGWSIIRWDGADLGVSLEAPGQVVVSQPFLLKATLQNRGSLPARNVVVKDLLPEGMRILGSQPDPDSTGADRRWMFGEMSPGASTTLLLDAVIDSPGSAQYRLSAESRYNSGQATRMIDAVLFPLDVVILSPGQVTVSETVSIRLQLTNTSGSELTEILLTDQLPEGLDHVDARQAEDSMARNLDFSITSIQPGETVEKELTLRPTIIGQLCHTLNVQLANGLSKSTRGCLESIPRPLPPELQFQLLGPNSLTAGRPASYRVQVQHVGENLVNEITLRLQIPESLVIQQATEGHRRRQNTIGLEIPRLAPGEQAELVVQVIALKETPLASLEGSLLVANQPVDSARIEVKAGAAEQDSSAPESPDPNRLTVSITDLDDPVTVGQKITYLVSIRNDRDVSDKQIRIQVELPEGLELVKFTQPHEGKATVDATQRTIQATEIKELLSREQLKPFRVEVIARRSGQFRVQVSVKSARSENLQQVGEETTVRPAP